MKLTSKPFRFFTTALLGLLLPLSFLLLARISCLNYLYDTHATPFTPPDSSSHFAFFFSVYVNPAVLYVAVSVASVSALVNGLTAETRLVNGSYPTRLGAAWVALCTLQLCVGLGIESSIAAGFDGVRFGAERSLVSRALFLLGLHETARLWTTAVVKPVVDETVCGGGGARREETWVDRLGMTASLGALWWWRMRDEVEALVVVAEAKRELAVGIGVADFVGWWLYYLTVTIGMVKVVKVFMWVSAVLLCPRLRGYCSIDNDTAPILEEEIEDKV